MQYERKPSKPTGESPPYDYRGMLIDNLTIASVYKENMAKSMSSNANNVIQGIASITDPMQFKNLVSFREDVYLAVEARKEMELKYMKEKARLYVGLRAEWIENCKVIDRYHEMVSKKKDEWPPSFYINTIPVEYAPEKMAPDQPMIMSRSENCYNDECSLVKDPVAAYIAYKNRLVWTDEEKQIFLDKYELFPRQFSRIAEYLPDKSDTDVVEYYYLHRIELDLKGVEERRKHKQEE